MFTAPTKIHWTLYLLILTPATAAVFSRSIEWMLVFDLFTITLILAIHSTTYSVDTTKGILIVDTMNTTKTFKLHNLTGYAFVNTWMVDGNDCYALHPDKLRLYFREGIIVEVSPDRKVQFMHQLLSFTGPLPQVPESYP